MSLTVAPSDRGKADHVVINRANWRAYRALQRELEEDEGNVRVTYSKGRLEIMSPLPEHESGKSLLAQMVEALTPDLRIPRACYGSTTFASQALDRGLEPDECYYIANEALMRGRKRIDLAVDPPPDLAIEGDINYRAIDRESIYAALGVPEVWRYDGRRLECLVLNAAGTYDRPPHGKAFPFLPVGELPRFMDRVPEIGENAMLYEFLDWARALPR